MAKHLIEHSNVNVYIHNGLGHMLLDAPHIIHDVIEIDDDENENEDNEEIGNAIKGDHGDDRIDGDYVNEAVDISQLSSNEENQVNESIDVHWMSEDGDHMDAANSSFLGGLNVNLHHANLDQSTRDGFYVEIDVLSDKDDDELINACGKQAEFWRQTHAASNCCLLDCDDVFEVPIRVHKGKGKEITEDINGDYKLSDSNTSIASSEREKDSNYIDSDDPREYVSNSGDELFAIDDALRQKTSCPVYDLTCAIPHFELGMKFQNHIKFKKAVAKYSSYKGFAPKWLRNAPDKQRIRCMAKNCPWYVSETYQKRDGSFKVVALVREHICL
ncbi:hypothetical protein SLEP1_g23438 [Rubroshorea leprosula]|uniref:Transposase MuDR plant domain-containing protein n=1 Tax=Rubroshorea leprosula TaxID=152421 RepID=A0AAV5JFE8_9ROSI|nr:hypothetical protein SLEP1_g23438 [Rubroshorea leprosula]